MTSSQKSTSLFRHPAIILFSFLLLAYLPVFLPFFHIKNDLITQNLPTRFFISESLYSKYFPWWNPYFNYGIPQYGDMNNGFWNPILWTIAKLFGYNVLTITIEEMLYIFIGGWGVYKLMKFFQIPEHVSIVGALSYMGGGYIIGHLQHFCWITGTAFFPYVFLFFLSSIKQPIVKNFILGGLFTFLFVASTHPGLIIGALYFFFFIVAHLIFVDFKERQLKNAKRILFPCLLFTTMGILFSVVVVYSNVEVLMQITRETKVSVIETLYAPTTPQSYLSLFFPFAVNKGSFFNTDISMRNMSIGIPLLPGLYFVHQYINFRKNWILILMFAFFVLLAAGGDFKLFAHRFFPLLGHVRLNGEFAYFPFLILIIAGGYGFTKGFLSGKKMEKAFVVITYFFIASTLLSLIALLIKKNSILFSSSSFQLKNIIDNFSFWDLMLLSSILNLFTSWLLRKKINVTYAFVRISFLSLMLIVWGCLPYTGLGQKSRKEVQQIVSSMPKGINKPSQKPIAENVYINTRYNPIIWSPGFYSKQIGYPESLPYPVVLKQTELFFADTALVKFIDKQSFIFLSKDSIIKTQTMFDSSAIQILKFSPIYTMIQVQNNGFKYLSFLQNNYPRWQVYIDGKAVQHFTVFKTFIGISVPEGKHMIEYKFDATSLQAVLLSNIFILFLALIALSQNKLVNKKLF